ncbi:MAG: hypothetical protein KGL39_39840 [Patescibacteria group bacterium]|nr:hypothetical protein [Patescibacteria group bacterium]
MPIRAENKNRYPPSWPEISRRIRFERAESRCECEGECGIDHSAEELAPEYQYRSCERTLRCIAEHGCIHPVTESRVVLTVAHLPGHPPEDCEDASLKAMCQRCHNRMDMPERRRGIAERARKLLAIADLFSGNHDEEA